MIDTYQGSHDVRDNLVPVILGDIRVSIKGLGFCIRTVSEHRTHRTKRYHGCNHQCGRVNAIIWIDQLGGFSMCSATRSISMFLVLGAITATAVGTGGCSSDQDTEGPYIETLPDGVVVVHNPDRGLWLSGDGWKIEEVVRIGAVEGAEPYIFENIRDIHLDSDGRIYILDDRARQVRVFDPGGNHVYTVGRQGEGPGEFRMPIGMTSDPDGNLWVVDVMSSRFTVLSPDGNLLNTIRREIVGFSARWQGAFSSDGALYEPGSSIDPDTGSSSNFYIRQVLQDGGLIETGRYELPDFDTPFYLVEFQGGAMSLPIPFSPQPGWVYDGKGGIWVATGDQYRFWHQSLSGTRTRIVELQREPIAVTESDRAEAHDDIEQYLRRVAGGVDQIDFSKIPRHKPAHGPIILDDQGYIWVVQTLPASPIAENGTPSNVFDVFDPEGRYLGPLEVTISLGPLPVIVAGRIAGVIREESGLERVVIYQIHTR
ncbi:6-bladed beta-propeller [Gemmatimonadota bacterium]